MNTHKTRSHRVSAPRGTPLVFLAGALLSSLRASADDIQWSNTGGGIFGVGANWIGGVAPGSADFARFGRTRDPNQPLSYTVTFGSNPANLGAVVEDDRVTFNLGGRAYSLTHPSLALAVGTSANVSGRLTLIDGAVATAPDSTVAIGASPGASGFLTLSTGAQLLGPAVQVGSSGPGTLVVQNNADIAGGPMLVGGVLPQTAPGTATVTGAGSSVVVEGLSVGTGSAGTLNIFAGGRVESTSGTLGVNSGIVGTINVEGLGSRWANSGSVLVGDDGRGTLNITGGGEVQCEQATVGFGSGGSNAITVGGANSTFSTDGILTVGSQGSGSMSMTGGGRAFCSTAVIGDAAPGSMSLQGDFSNLFCSERLIVAHGANSGTLNLIQGGRVQSPDIFLSLASGPGAAVVSGPGSLLFSSHYVSVGGNAYNEAPGGSALLAVRDGASSFLSTVYLFPHGTVELSGGLFQVGMMVPLGGPGGAFSFTGGELRTSRIGFGVLNQGGTLTSGSTRASTWIQGNYTQQAGAMQVFIVGSSFELQGQVLVDGHMTAGGELSVILANFHFPAPGSAYVILESGDPISGAFANAANGQRFRNNSGTMLVHYGPGSPFDPSKIVLSDFEFCPSDFDHDGFVDFLDVQAFITCFEGDGCPPGQGPDFNGDAFVDFFDAAEFIDAFEAGC